MKLETLKSYIAMGREIEFSYHGEMFSITYTYDNERQTICFCQFNQSSKDYDSLDDFLVSASIGDEHLQAILDHIENIVVY